ncbi:hypothetical protein A8708_07500 [Paenibacillus oryzisoli]|uniref:Uncharacterized protein n=2 Tax=Paenibacillus oryzisoli TaxID=1850517 RepID=A0A198A6U3_9BACL|nr:hypothetical protein A8708_07500 [Paenibacillus oryzisoli]
MVSPGKDVTLYIPTETPPEVIAYMNQLKAEGMFSHGIMDILTKHILGEQSLAKLATEGEPHLNMQSFVEDDILFTAPIEHQESIDTQVSNSQKNFSLEDIFRQASRNAGKLI